MVWTQEPQGTEINTRDVAQVKSVLRGCVIGWLDKNNGECSCVCPSLYERTLSKLFDETASSYTRVWPLKDTAYKRKKHGTSRLLANMVTADRASVRANQLSVEREQDKHLVTAWRWHYRKRGWHKVTRFNVRGRITQPYALYKAKNVTDPETRATKVHKARPITPYSKHPMAKLLSLVGRAWSFALRHLKGEHFIVHDCQSVPALLHEISEQLRPKGRLTYSVSDLEGCYTSMPKAAMNVALRDVLNQVKAALPPGAGADPAIFVPKRGKKKCQWAQHARDELYGAARIPFSLMMEVVEFDLENCFVLTTDGRLLKQTGGVPMGSALSPALAVGTLAWMEQEWMASLEPDAKTRFRMGRYMDDVLTVVAHSDEWRADELVRDFESSTCYMPPLKLDRADSTYFLETRIELTSDGHFRHRLKNVNEGKETRPAVWRYHRWDSASQESMKEGVLIGCLQKVMTMASDTTSFQISLQAKMREFNALGYPYETLRRAIERMYARGYDSRWLHARAMLRREFGDDELLVGTY